MEDEKNSGDNDSDTDNVYVKTDTEKKTRKKSKYKPYIDPKYHFKPGVSGNPAGGPKLPEELRKKNKLSAKLFISYVNKYFAMTMPEMKKSLADPKATVLELFVGKMIHKAVTTQDVAKANFILDRSIGKVIEKMEMEVHLPKPTIIERMNGQQLILGYSESTIDGEVIDEGDSSDRVESTDS